jgi:hypothetical protein
MAWAFEAIVSTSTGATTIVEICLRRDPRMMKSSPSPLADIGTRRRFT